MIKGGEIMKRLYVHKSAAADIIQRENTRQNKNKRFINISVKPYKGSKYGPDYVTICIG